MSSPYADFPNYCFWSRGVTWVNPAQIDPMVRAPFLIKMTDKVGTMGSCFAQHISRHLQSAGFNYFVPESAPKDLSPEVAREQNYGVFSARFGNVYTVRQAVQLFDRAFGHATFESRVWKKGDQYVDPFRPQITPDGYENIAELQKSEKIHLAAVRRMFQESDVLVFTLGLTEAWRSISDGAVYPTAPGVSGGDFDPKIFEPVNFSINEVTDDLDALCRKLLDINPNLKIILTVSPVPLKATFEDRHVLQSTVYSKSVLRVAAQAAADKFDAVCYFPSYEIITGPAGAGRYYAPDLREVRDIGVRHVMRVFERHFLTGDNDYVPDLPIVANDSLKNFDIICDEDVLDAAIAGSQVIIASAQGEQAETGLSSEDVFKAYQLFLGRMPESDEVVALQRKMFNTRTALASAMLRSEEFGKRMAGNQTAEDMAAWFGWATKWR